MFKRKSIATIKDVQVAVPSNAELEPEPKPEPEPAPARSIRQYDITAASAWTRKFKIKEQASRNVIYRLEFTTSIPGWTMLLTTGEPKSPNASTAAAARVSVWRTITHIAIGDPRSELKNRQLIELKLDSKWKHNKYAVSLPLPPSPTGESRILELQWKGTNQVKGFMKKMDRGMHHKLVEKSTNRLLACYYHDPWSFDVAGTVEICADIEGLPPQAWDLFVLVSALAVAEKTLKMVKMSADVGDIGDAVEGVAGVVEGVQAVSGR